jgi:glutamate-5-semialdehyde dehydrogenase
MSAVLQTPIDALATQMLDMGKRARQAARSLALASTEAKNTALNAAAVALRAMQSELIAANAQDINEAKANGANTAYIDRLMLDEKRIEGIASSLEDIAKLPDPVGRELAKWQQPNGLKFERIATSIGVIGIIFESRPNVTADAGGLCLKAGNAVILRAGSDSLKSAMVIHKALAQGLKVAGLPEHAVQIVPTKDRAAVGHMLAGLNGAIDVIVPRGGKGLVARVQAEARVPVFAHLDGVNHIYVHKSADLAKSVSVIINAKLRRTGVCGAVETLLIDRAVTSSHGLPIIKALLDKACEVRGCAETQKLDAHVKPATYEDWGTEYGDAIVSIKIVSGLDEAIEHIETHGSHHTDAIMCENEAITIRFLNEVDSAIVLHNASTQFADGGEFGFGAEIGIATGRMHARGPVGLEQLTSFKYRVRGNGTIRP